MKRFTYILSGLNRGAAFVGMLAWAAVALGASAAGTTSTPGRVIGWGWNGNGQVNAPAGTDFVAVAAGDQHSIGLKSDGTVVGWGLNGNGQAGPPAGLSNVVAIAAGEYHSLAAKSDGTVVGWGNNFDGQAAPPAGLTNVIAVAAGGDHSVALKRDGTVIGWGDNFRGQTTIPPGLNGVIAIAAGRAHNLALKSDGTVVGWGYNDYNQALPPPGLTNVIAIAARRFHSLALKADGTVVAWGLNAAGETIVPTGLTGVVAIGAGGYDSKFQRSDFSLALKNDNTVVAWGSNAFGQQTPPAGISTILAFATGGAHVLAIVPPDSTPPVITSTLTGTLLNNGWYINNVDVAWTVTDPDSTVSSKTGCDASTVNTDTTGQTFTCSATSNGGTSSKSVVVKRDATNPGVSCGSPDALWRAADASVACTASDTTSGLASAGDASFNLTTSVANGTETANASTGTRTIYDNAGNSSGAGPISNIKVDKKGPAITVTAPTAKQYLLNETVTAGYSCSDGGSGLASCSGTVANGVNLNTASAGAKTFTVNAKDNVNNASTSSVNYTVGYAFSGFGTPLINPPGVNTGNAGSTFPLKWQLRDANGSPISALSAIASLTLKSTSCTAFTNDPAGASPLPGSTGLTYNAPLWQYGWKSSKAAGCYTVFLTLSSGQVFPAYFRLN